MQSIKRECFKLDIEHVEGSYNLWRALIDHILLKVISLYRQLVLFFEAHCRDICHVSLETEYSAVLVINYTILRS